MESFLTRLKSLSLSHNISFHHSHSYSHLVEDGQSKRNDSSRNHVAGRKTIHRDAYKYKSGKRDKTLDLSGFSHLPPELRFLIWEYTLPDPHLIRLDITPLFQDPRYSTLSSIAPIALSTCRESRMVALEHLTTCISTPRLSPKIRMRGKRDVLFLNAETQWTPFMRTLPICDFLKGARLSEMWEVEEANGGRAFPGVDEGLRDMLMGIETLAVGLTFLKQEGGGKYLKVDWRALMAMRVFDRVEKMIWLREPSAGWKDEAIFDAIMEETLQNYRDEKTMALQRAEIRTFEPSEFLGSEDMVVLVLRRSELSSHDERRSIKSL